MLRILDANFNRLKEGLRVLEEISRFVLNDRKETARLKRIRHQLDSLLKQMPFSRKELLRSRESQKDVGKNTHGCELKRDTLRDVYFANMQRAKESARVLEEFSKLIDIDLSGKFKKIRYSLYNAEKYSVLD